MESFMVLENKLGRKSLVKGLLGVLPIPIVGEIGLSMFFYDLLKGKSEVKLEYAAIPAALLTRLAMYRDVYFPIYEKIVGN